MATPHVASGAALILSKNPTRTQAQIESTLKGTALAIPSSGNQNVFDFDHFADISWDTDCDGTPCDPVGSGLLQVDEALAATPSLEQQSASRGPPSGGPLLLASVFARGD